MLLFSGLKMAVCLCASLCICSYLCIWTLR